MKKNALISREDIPRVLVILGICAFLIAMVWCFPVTGDDWGKLAAGRESLNSPGEFFSAMHSRWSKTNGRILGNILGVYGVNFPVFDIIFRSGVILGIILTLTKLTGKISASYTALVAVVCFAIPKLMFRQTYAWHSGFYNYVVPVLFILLYFYIIRELFLGERITSTPQTCIAAAVCGVCSQLFMENITLYVFLMSAFTVTFYRVRHKRFSAVTLSYFAGAIAGAIAMFSSPVYRRVVSGGDAYRTMSFSLSALFDTAKDNFETVSDNMLGKNLLLSTVLCVCCLALWLIKPEKQTGKKGGRASRTTSEARDFPLLRTSSIFVLAAAPAYFFITSDDFTLDTRYGDDIFYLWFSVMVNALLLAAVIYTVVCNVKDGRVKFLSLFLLCSSVAVAAPLLVVTPIGPRCFYISYIFLLGCVLTLAPEIIKSLGLIHKITPKLVAVPVAAVCVAVAFFYLNMFTQVHAVEIERAKYISSCVDKGMKEIEYPALPYWRYLHDEPNEEKMKSYFAPDSDIEFRDIGYGNWSRFNYKTYRIEAGLTK